nr:helix-turn-helix transcriptional regulator [uncultured Blautia sp.]
MDAKKFGAFIADRRKQQHMTQAELAWMIGVTDKAVSRWERGLGFPDINTMEPLADALGISLLELMRSQVQKPDNEKDPETIDRESTDKDENQGDTDSGYDRVTSGKTYTSAEVTEIMHTMEEIRKQQQHQDKMAGYLTVPVILIVSILSKLSGNASLAGAIFVGFLGAGAVVSGYYLWENRADAESRRIYGFFTLFLTGIFLSVCSLLIPDSFWEHHAQWANIFACLFNLAVIGYMDYHILKNRHKEKRKLFTVILVLGVNILLVVWSLHSFAAKSIEDAMGTSRGDVAEQYATQLLLKEKNLKMTG